jgi:hypothetical protein
MRQRRPGTSGKSVTEITVKLWMTSLIFIAFFSYTPQRHAPINADMATAAVVFIIFTTTNYIIYAHVMPILRFEEEFG